MAETSCVFCKILAGEIPSTKVFEDRYTVAFLDIRPANKGHVLVIPREHHSNIYEIPDSALCDMVKTAKQIALALKKATNADGINILMNNDRAAGQDVFHAHMHVVPRFAEKGHHYYWNGHETYNEGEAEEIAQKIRAAL